MRAKVIEALQSEIFNLEYSQMFTFHWPILIYKEIHWNLSSWSFCFCRSKENAVISTSNNSPEMRVAGGGHFENRFPTGTCMQLYKGKVSTINRNLYQQNVKQTDLYVYENISN